MTRYVVVKVWRGLFEGIEEFPSAAQANDAAAAWVDEDEGENDAGVLEVATDGARLDIAEV